MIDGFCQGADAVTGRVDTGEAIGSAIDWLCALQPSISRVRDLAEGASEDLTGFFVNADQQQFRKSRRRCRFRIGRHRPGGLAQRKYDRYRLGRF